MMFNKILIALDLDDIHADLFDKAVTLARATGANLMLLSVLTPEGDGSLALPAYSGLAYYPLELNESVWNNYQQRRREYEAKGLKLLRDYTDQAMSIGVHTEFTQVFDSPGRAICDLAKTWQADLVMVGSHGRTGLSEMFLGSVSNYVMHHAPCSVLVVHGQTKPETANQASDLAAVEG
ncbi:MAG: universal stress protein [Cyanobacteria bacterium J06639_16]